MRRETFKMLMVILVMGVGLLGCSKADTKPPVEDTSAVAGEEMATEGNDDKPKQDVMEEGAEKPLEEEEKKPGPRVAVTQTYYDAGDDVFCFSGFYATATVVGEDYPELKQAVDSWFLDFKNSYESDAAEYIAEVKGVMNEEFYDMGNYALEYTVKATRSDSRITSILLDEYSYRGGAHGSTYMYGLVFDSKTGQEIAFDDLGDIREDVKAHVTEYVQKKRQEEGYSYDFFEGSIDDILANPVWYLDGFGLNIIFNQYEIASYAEGITIVTIPYEELSGMKEAYKLDGDAMYARLIPNETYEIDVNDDGTKEKVRLACEYDENVEMEMSLGVGDLDLHIGHCSHIENMYYVKADNQRSFVLISYDAMSDDYVTELIELSSGTPVKCDTLGGGSLYIMSTNLIGMRCTLYTMGTYCAEMNYHFSDGVFAPEEERFTFMRDEAMDRDGVAPVTKQAVSVMLEKGGEMVEEELPVGTKIYPINTDNESVLGFELEDGTYGEISFTKKEGLLYIDGVTDFDIFDNLPYVG